jgi:D-alanyl-D-alanine carboxypeptidase
MQDMPNIETLQIKVLNHLKQGKPITNREAVQSFQCYRLGDVIHRLRKKGHEIETDLIPNQTNHQKHAKYTLITQTSLFS